MLDLIDLVQRSEWIEADRAKHSDYVPKREHHEVNDGVLFLKKVSIVPNKSIQAAILRQADSLCIEKTRTAARVKEDFEWFKWHIEVG